MATIQVNKVIPVMALSFLGMVGYLYVKTGSGSSNASPATVSSGQFMTRAPVARTADADTPNDTIRAIRGQMNTIRSEVLSTQQKNEVLMAERNTALEEKAQADREYSQRLTAALEKQDKASAEKMDVVLSRFNTAINELSDSLGQNYSNINRTLENTLNRQSGVANDSNNVVAGRTLMIPAGFGLEVESGAFLSGEEMVGVFWIEPLDESITHRRNAALPMVAEEVEEHRTRRSTLKAKGEKLLLEPLQQYRKMLGEKALESDGQGLLDDSDSDADGVVWVGGGGYGRVSRGLGRTRSGPRRQVQRVEGPGTQAYYTIPDLSMLSGSRSITSLVGKIYPDKEIVEPQLFKLIVGRDNITANLTDLPTEIEGMIFEGYAVGDFTRRCITGNLIAATFIFEDGSIRSMYPGDPGSRPALNDQNRSRIGYISDIYGNPCIAGRLITDAREYLTAGAVLATLGAYSAAVRNTQTSTTNRLDDDTGEVRSTRTRVDGDPRQYALASGVLGGLDVGTALLDELYQASESAIYAPAGEFIDIHIQQELRLDMSADRRKVRYVTPRATEAYLD